jgi:hypothetical protein
MARRRVARPFPLDALVLSSGAVSLLAFARRAGVHNRQVHRWRSEGLTLAQADTLACRLGLHPVEVWPVEYGAAGDAPAPDEVSPGGGGASDHDDPPTPTKGRLVHPSTPVFPTTFRASRWQDASADGADCFAATSPYVEALWLPVLGPSATWALRRLAAFLDSTDDCLVNLDELGRSLGLGSRTGKHSAIAVALGRVVRFDIARWDGSTLAVRRRLPPVPYHLRRKLPPYLNDLHDRMTRDREAPAARVA